MNRALAAELAHLSQLAYASPDVVAGALPDAEVEFFDRDGAQAYGVTREDYAVIVFRGTQVTANWSWSDVLANIKLRRRPWGNLGTVHRGYAAEFAKLGDAVDAFAAGVVDGRLFVTGHSLGGAIAILAAVSMERCAAAYTFGAPRVGDRTFARWLDAGVLVHRIVYENDIAPKYPTPWLTGYRHGGEFWHLTADGELTRKPWTAWRRLIVPFTRAGITAGVLDHRIGIYAARLATLVSET